MKYDFNAIEQRWQDYWAERSTFRTPNPGEEGFDADRPKYYVLDMFPYPSGVGLHVGHPLGYIATDIVARYKRMRGFNVLHPMGYDAFGLPAEQFAVEHGVHPRITTEKNIANMTRQLKRLGLSYDWDRCVATIEPGYYKWTQWIFLQLYNAWFDPRTNQAQPIAELQRALESDEIYVDVHGQLIFSHPEGLDGITAGPIGASKWSELTNEQRWAVLDNHRLAYRDEVPVNWCPQLGTVLANEEVTNDGRSERGNYPVYRRPLKQWMLRITAFADRLEKDLDKVDWPEAIKIMQRNWIGRSEGAWVDFQLVESSEALRVFTTRPDTLFGATYMVVAPEHPLLEEITTDDRRAAVERYRTRAAQRSEMDRTAESKTKTGEFTGGYAINPVNDQKIPIWVADYVMMGYGTGAIMAVPAHDTRDHEFARTFDLPIVQVIASSENIDIQEQAWTGDGILINSENADISINDLNVTDAKKRITNWLEEQGLGRSRVQYKLRDWLFSRQRYWGEPFPILHAPDGRTIAVDESELPVTLPEMDNFSPEASDDADAPPRPPLGRAPESWRVIERDGVRYERELNTMPQWAGSCWYYLRFLDPKNSNRFVSEEAERYWMLSRKNNQEQGGKVADDRSQYHAGGVDLYVGGAEHAVLHLLYARFWHKVLYDLGHVSTPEPFGRLFNQGYIQAHAYTDARGVYVSAEEIEEKDGKWFYKGESVNREFGKMGKSLKNAITPDEICEEYGCDTMRLYEMYLGPLDQSKVWNTRDIIGVHRFLQRLWRNFVDEETGDLLVTDSEAGEELKRLTNRTIKRVTDDMERMSFNTAIAALIELNNALVSLAHLPRETAEAMILLLGPIAPHMAEELWRRMGHEESLAYETWPMYDEKWLLEDTVELPVQINGKMRGKIAVPTDSDDAAIEAAAKEADNVKSQLEGKTVRKVIIVKGRLVNIVAN